VKGLSFARELTVVGRSARRLIAPVVAVAALLALAPAPAVAAGPWKGQIVDSETGRPLPDVIVFAVWWKRFPVPPFIHEGHSFHRAFEVVTDVDGRFEIPAVSTRAVNPFVRIEGRPEASGPDLTIFRAGYGRWRFRGEPPYSGGRMSELDAWLEKAWKRFEDTGVVIELPPVRMVDERLAVVRSAWPYQKIPASEGIRLRRAVEAESNELGRLKSQGR
jgi:hypothetical protein